jgi:transposase
MLTVFNHTSHQESQHMLTQEEDVDIHAMQRRGWTVSAIARHTGHDRKTVRAYMNGQRQPGARRQARPDAFADYLDYVGIRLRDDPHLWASVLHDEVVELGYERSYQRFTAE